MSISHGPLSFRNLPPVIRTVVTLCLAGYISMFFAQERIISLLGLIPRRVTEDLWLWQLLSYGLFHGSLFHLLFNMLALWMFGREVESRMGTPEFFKYYLLTTLGASLTQVALLPSSPVPSIGASGAIYGVLAAFGILFPEAVIYMYFLIPLKSRQLVMLFAVLEFLAGMSSSGSGVANFAHLGGLLTGLLYFKLPQWFTRFRETIKGASRSLSGFKRPARAKPPRENAELLELAREVDRILEKVLREGAGSLTPEEQDIMQKYSKKKH